MPQCRNDSAQLNVYKHIFRHVFCQIFSSRAKGYFTYKRKIVSLKIFGRKKTFTFFRQNGKRKIVKIMLNVLQLFSEFSCFCMRLGYQKVFDFYKSGFSLMCTTCLQERFGTPIWLICAVLWPKLKKSRNWRLSFLCYRTYFCKLSKATKFCVLEILEQIYFFSVKKNVFQLYWGVSGTLKFALSVSSWKKTNHLFFLHTILRILFVGRGVRCC